jgi:hypothetical protein
MVAVSLTLLSHDGSNMGLGMQGRRSLTSTRFVMGLNLDPTSGEMNGRGGASFD